MPKAFFLEERTDDVNGAAHLIQESLVGLQKELDERIQTVARGLVKWCWLGKEKEPHCK